MTTYFEVKEPNRWQVDLQGVASAPSVAQDALQELEMKNINEGIKVPKMGLFSLHPSVFQQVATVSEQG